MRFSTSKELHINDHLNTTQGTFGVQILPMNFRHRIPIVYGGPGTQDPVESIEYSTLTLAIRPSSPQPVFYLYV